MIKRAKKLEGEVNVRLISEDCTDSWRELERGDSCRGASGYWYKQNWSKMETVLLEGLRQLRLNPSQRQIDQCRMYYSELLRWNRVVSLISKRDERRFITKHLLPSVAILPFLPSPLSSLADVGSGAGLPGIPLKIVAPELQLTVIEAKVKKALFLKEIVRKLSLEKVEVRNERAEGVKSVYPVVITRALGKLEKAGRICLPLVASNGTLIIFRGIGGDEEGETAVAGIEKYGGRLREGREIVFPVTDERGRLLFVSKVSRET